MTLSLILIYIPTMLSRTLPLARTMFVARPSSSRSGLSGSSALSTTLGRTRLYSTPAAPAGLDEGERAIYEKLSAKFPGNRLEVQDVSGQFQFQSRVDVVPLPIAHSATNRKSSADTCRRVRVVLRHRNQLARVQRPVNDKAT